MTMKTSHTSAAPLDFSLAEHGRPANGSSEPTSLDRRLFFQLLVLTGCTDTAPLQKALTARGIEAVLYKDVHDPRGVGLLTFAEDPAFFTETVRPLVNEGPFAALRLDRSYSMFGRTYSIGYEADLESTLIHRPRSRVLDPTYPWAVWYPLRRSGAFEQLDADTRRAALMEHGSIGRRFGEAGHAQDIRLDCHVLDAADNDFVIGLVGPKLHPLSAVVQAMRQTVQTSQFVERMGPFFVGHAVRP